MRDILLVGAGGFLGSALRFAASNAVQLWAGNTALPYGTLFVNLTGAFILGGLMEILSASGAFSPQVRLFVGVGILGGYTTFSTLAYESMNLINTSEYLLAALYALGSVAVGIAATFTGMAVMRVLMRFAAG